MKTTTLRLAHMVASMSRRMNALRHSLSRFSAPALGIIGVLLLAACNDSTGPTPVQVAVQAVVPDGTYTVSAVFSQGTNQCNFPEGFTDTLIITVEGGTITINQPSTGDVNVGTIAADGSFLVESQFESYGGADGSGTAVNTDGSGCIVAYQVVFTPQG